MTPTPPRAPRGNLFVLAANSFFRGAHHSIYSVIWQPYVLSLGASMPTLGLLNSLGGMGGIVTTVIQALGGWFADRMGRKPFIIAAGIANIAAYALFAISGWLQIWTLLLIGIMSSVVSITWVIAQMPIGRYIDRRGTKAMLIFSELLGIPVMLIWLTQSSFESFVISHALFALTAATWVPTINTHLSRCVTDAERGEAFGRLNAFKGLISFPSSAIGGLLYTWGGL